jgi:chemotaxis protein methyltransferase CheR
MSTTAAIPATHPTTMGPVSTLQLELLRGAIASRFGFCIKDSWSGQLDVRLAARAAATGRAGIADYLAGVLGPAADEAELLALVETLLIGETNFMRTEPHFQALTEKVLPAWRESRQPQQRFRIASLGCSTGEEPYSIALTLHESLTDEEFQQVEITGVDVNGKALEAARQGRYELFQLRELTSDQRTRWFKSEGARVRIHPRLRSTVRFLQHNLLHPLPFAGLDAIFCRNVLIYFAPDSSAFCFGEFHAALRPGGYLFLGHAESALGFPKIFEPVPVRDAVIYQSKPSLS